MVCDGSMREMRQCVRCRRPYRQGAGVASARRRLFAATAPPASASARVSHPALLLRAGTVGAATRVKKLPGVLPAGCTAAGVTMTLVKPGQIEQVTPAAVGALADVTAENWAFCS